jgi:hypothetical protein
MHRTLAIVAIAAAAGLSASLAVSQESGKAPARVICRDGQIVGLEVLLPAPGHFVLELPLGVCAKSKDKPKPAPRRPPTTGGVST